MLGHMLMHPSPQGTLLSFKAIAAQVTEIQAYVHHLSLHLTSYFTRLSRLVCSGPLIGVMDPPRLLEAASTIRTRWYAKRLFTDICSNGTEMDDC